MIKLFFILLFVLFSLNALATTYYVSVYGDNNNPGTEAQPWLTIQKAADTMSESDTVYIKEGSYSEQVIPQS